MRTVQENFDKKVAPACPSQLKSPVLHSVLSDKELDKWIYGAKGVGSQGDGTVQLLAKDEECQRAVIDYLSNVRGMEAFPLTLKPKQAVRKAVIPVAGPDFTLQQRQSRRIFFLFSIRMGFSSRLSWCF